jgi:predicted amidohydrolase YtcJ
MTHEYTLLLGGTILTAPDAPPASAIAWAEGFVLAIGSDASVRGISRGDSTTFELAGRFVVPLGPDGAPPWPPVGRLEVGGPADLAVLASDPRPAGAAAPLAVVRGGRLVAGSFGPAPPPPSGARP